MAEQNDWANKPWAKPGLTTKQRAEIARNYHYGSYELVKEACDASVADAAPRWVPVGERLPEEGYPCWFSDGVNVFSMTYHGTIPYKATHWQACACPAPPREEDAK